MQFDIYAIEAVTAQEKAYLLSILSIGIPLSRAGIEPSQAISLATQQIPALPPYRENLSHACDLSKIATEEEMLELHFEIANLINQWRI